MFAQINSAGRTDRPTIHFSLANHMPASLLHTIKSRQMGSTPQRVPTQPLQDIAAKSDILCDVIVPTRAFQTLIGTLRDDLSTRPPQAAVELFRTVVEGTTDEGAAFEILVDGKTSIAPILVCAICPYVTSLFPSTTTDKFLTQGGERAHLACGLGSS